MGTAARLACAVIPLTAAVWVMPAHAQTLTWDASGASPAAATDGSGNWNNTSINWSDGVNSSSWVGGSVAAFGNGGNAGTITINDPSGTVNVGGITFNPVASGSYTIVDNGATSLTLSGTGVINTAAGVTGNISAPIAGSVGLTYNGAGVLNLNGNNTFTGTAAINSGTVVVGAGGKLGASTNAVVLGTPGSATAVGALSIAGSNTVGAFSSTTNTATANTLAVGSGATFNVTSAVPTTGLNAVFQVGGPNALASQLTTLTMTGGGSLNVNGGNSNSSFVVGVGNTSTGGAGAPSSTPVLDMSGLSNFSFITGASPTVILPGGAGNMFAVGVGTTVKATVTLATNNTITAPIIDIGDGAPTPGAVVSGSGGSTPVAGTANSVLNFGTGANVLRTNTLMIGGNKSTADVKWASSTGTGSLLITGLNGGTSTVDIVIGTASSGGTNGSASTFVLTGHNTTIQAGNLIIGKQTTGAAATASGGRLNLDNGVINANALSMAVVTGGTIGAGKSLTGTLNLGGSSSTTAILNVANSFSIASNNTNQGGNGAIGAFNINTNGIANINTNIIDSSTGAGTSSTAITLSGGTLNMNGFAIGTTTPISGGKRPVGVVFPTLGNSAVLQNLGGDGINGAGLTMNTTGVLVLEGNSTYTGTTTISNGTLQVGQASDVVAPTGALAANVFDNSILSFGSSQSLTNSTAVSGTGGVAQTGTGVTTLAGNSSYTGPTYLVNGVLATASLPNGATSSPIGASSNSAGNLVLTGGALRYTGAGGSTDRLFSVAATGGSIDASGTGAVVFNNGGSVVSADPAPRATTDSTANAKLTLPSVADLVAGMSVTGTNIPPGTTIVSINPTASSITLSAIPTAAGADVVSFGTAARTLTLTGTNAAANTMGNVLSDSAGGGTLSVTKSGAGTWRLTSANTYSGVTTVNGGALQLTNAASNPVLTGAGGADVKQGRLVFDYTGGASPAAQVESLLTTAYASSFAAGQIRSSTATPDKGLGWTDTGGTTVTVAPALYGDADLNGSVDLTDFTFLAGNFNKQSGSVWKDGDFNYDDHVDLTDFTLLAAHFNQTLPADAGGSLGALVPEPGAITTLAMLACLLPRRRRHR